MNLENKILTIKKKVVTPRVHCIELVHNNISYLYICVAYSLEEAFDLAKQKLVLEMRSTQPIAISVGKYVSVDVMNVLKDATEIVLLEPDAFDKNKLMKQIIDSQDVNLYHESLTLFTKLGQLLLKEKLKI